jgi:hypothetical protein
MTMCWHCDIADRLAAMADAEPNQVERDALTCMAIEQHVRCECPSCPTCGLPLDDRGPFDGTEPSSGVKDGHVGFGDTLMCESGHWFARIQGALVPPQRILTVVSVPSPIDAAWVAHVADVLEDHGATGYEATADYADALLRAYPALREMASQYHNGDAGRDWLVDAVNTAVQSNAEQGGF